MGNSLKPDHVASTIDDLREFIAALDRRVPGLERRGEIDIARDAAALRDKALKRLASLEPVR